MDPLFEDFVKKACRSCLRQGGKKNEMRAYIALLPPPSRLAFFRRCDRGGGAGEGGHESCIRLVICGRATPNAQTHRHLLAEEELFHHIQQQDFASAAALHEQTGNIDEAIAMYNKAGPTSQIVVLYLALGKTVPITILVGDTSRALQMSIRQVQLHLLWPLGHPQDPTCRPLVFTETALKYIAKLDVLLSEGTPQAASNPASSRSSELIRQQVKVLHWLRDHPRPSVGQQGLLSHVEWMDKVHTSHA